MLYINFRIKELEGEIFDKELYLRDHQLLLKKAKEEIFKLREQVSQLSSTKSIPIIREVNQLAPL